MRLDPTAVVNKGANVGEFCSVGPFVAVCAGATVGEGTVIEAHCLIESDAEVGEQCVIEPHSTIRKWVVLRDKVRWGSGARAVLGDGAEIRVCEGAVIGANALLIAQSGALIIGKGAVVEPGAIVLENVPPGTVARRGYGEVILGEQVEA